MKLYGRFAGIKNRRKRSLLSQFLPFTRVFLTGIAVLALSACSGSSDVSNVDDSVAIQSDELVIANALYSDIRTPEGFYKEDFQGDTFYSISHVKNISLLPTADRVGLPVHELASDDFAEAMTWSDKAAEFQQSYEQLAGNTETMMYFQFTRFDPALPQFINLHRVFKASVLDRNGVDRNDENTAYKGRITLPDLSAENVKLIVEYLWTFTLNNNYSNAVLESYTIESESEFTHIMKQAQLSFNNNGGCDDVEVYEVRYRISRDSGFIWKEKVLTDTFAVKRAGSYLEICQ
ncbi:hypothetical protein MNBD_GAMMA06-1924 [hydrothermal vent metagenome]|uniref:Uncharacterized protein n=1 Tax=hydrothermal vent metagenome TaxID=652676 RepID=A0A3B0WV41_9ZZZZ